MDDVLSHSGGRPLHFVDEEEYTKIAGTPPNLQNGEACNTFSSQLLIICIKSLDFITPAVEPSISHELGHLLLTCHEYPRSPLYASPLLGELHNIIEHSIFYPWLKTNYDIDLYKIGNQRLVNFLKKDLPNLGRSDQSLIFSYAKFMVEADDAYWQERLQKACDKKNHQYKNIADKAMQHIKELPMSVSDVQHFKNKFVAVLETLNIAKDLWPEFLCSITIDGRG